ncbi:D-ribitol-5-phosphate cytidylyltransferase isoform X1 [Octopus vulgaris]|uniref:D-ribitol-5-phosphate cytidylyltransferase isoform X1 n=2 Tax=Octopus TaxID=6643 RepID=A0AA36ASS6_OCTVU|nr:D-ribitol-5-phosphate cytidylyltransferase isoform X1 [Octopus sinensis]CAI9721434.1 D-ribitol-5-phosphate cytidylyltransferase isoform X1 [Octopus vulgaris]
MSGDESPVDFNVCVVLPAGGYGSRTGVPTPKQFWPIMGKPLIAYTLETFNRISWVQKIIVTVAEEYSESLEDLVSQHLLDKVHVAIAGATRHRSIYNGIRTLSSVCEELDIILVNEAARPIVSESVIQEVALAAQKYGAAGIVRPLVSTVVAVNSDNFLKHSLDRNLYHASEMPQGFKHDIIKKAYEMCTNDDFENGSECLQLVQKYTNVNAYLIDGPSSLWKVTYRKDLYTAEGTLKEKFLKVGLVNIPDSNLVAALKSHLVDHHIEVCTLDSADQLPKQLTSVVLSQSTVNLDEILETTEELAQVWTEEPGRFIAGGTVIYLFHTSEEDCFADIWDQLQKSAETLADSFKDSISPIFILTKDNKNVTRIAKIVKSLVWEMSDTYAGQVFIA